MKDPRTSDSDGHTASCKRTPKCSLVEELRITQKLKIGLHRKTNLLSRTAKGGLAFGN